MTERVAFLMKDFVLLAVCVYLLKQDLLRLSIVQGSSAHGSIGHCSPAEPLQKIAKAPNRNRVVGSRPLEKIAENLNPLSLASSLFGPLLAQEDCQKDPSVREVSIAIEKALRTRCALFAICGIQRRGIR